MKYQNLRGGRIVLQNISVRSIVFYDEIQFRVADITCTNQKKQVSCLFIMYCNGQSRSISHQIKSRGSGKLSSSWSWVNAQI